MKLGLAREMGLEMGEEEGRKKIQRKGLDLREEWSSCS